MTKIILEPGLEEMAANLGPWGRKRLARVFRRWANQLEVSAAITLRNRCSPPKKIKRLSSAKLVMN